MLLDRVAVMVLGWVLGPQAEGLVASSLHGHSICHNGLVPRVGLAQYRVLALM